jgi:hypothetical protein
VTKKVKNTLKFLAYNAVFSALLFLGVVKGIAGFMNIVGFLVVLTFVIVVSTVFLILSLDESLKQKIASSNSDRVYPRSVSLSLSIAYTITFAYYGHFFLAFLYMATSFMTYLISDWVEEARKAQESE